MHEDNIEPIKVLFHVRIEGRTKTLYEFRIEGSLVHHTPQEVEDLLAHNLTRAQREIRTSGFTRIELAGIRSHRDRSLKYLKETSPDAN